MAQARIGEEWQVRNGEDCFGASGNVGVGFGEAGVVWFGLEC